MQDPIRITLTVVDDDDDLEPEEAEEKGSEENRTGEKVSREALEVKKELDLVPPVPQASLTGQKYTDDSEATINEHINVEYNVSYVYHAMFAYFDRNCQEGREKQE
ncbi:hypothetical protein GYH30_001710 [Glycine max]|nr:hypothetical protein GYH30_001710 [Glycine max]